jgi:multisubunit Na+/H+ antiporter MnhE subunit
MFYEIAIILAILWLLGVVTSYTMGGLIHALLLAAIVTVVVNVITDARRLRCERKTLRTSINQTSAN